MGNLSHYAGSTSGHNNNNVSNNPGSPGEAPDHADGYASEDFVPGSSSSRERKKGLNFIFIFGYGLIFGYFTVTMGLLPGFKIDFFFLLSSCVKNIHSW